jgi:hypothetical protein
MAFFDDPKQENFKADFGFCSPRRTKTKCKNPVFADHHLHRIALMKDFHVGTANDRDKNGLPGWFTKEICTGCGKHFKQGGYFIRD